MHVNDDFADSRRNSTSSRVSRLHVKSKVSSVPLKTEGPFEGTGMHGMHGRASRGRVWTFGSGPSLRFDDPHELRAWACAASSGVCARHLPARWAGEPEEGVHAGGELREAGWASYLEEDLPAQPAPRLTRAPARWTPPALRVEAAAPFGGFLVSPGVRLLAAAKERTGEGTT